MGASNSWNPQGLSRPVMGLLYFYLNSTIYEKLWKIYFCTQELMTNQVDIENAIDYEEK
jgi:hypothetical protein